MSFLLCYNFALLLASKTFGTVNYATFNIMFMLLRMELLCFRAVLLFPPPLTFSFPLLKSAKFCYHHLGS